MKSEQIVSLSIDAFTPGTLSMSRLADYLTPFSAMLGSDANVHFDGVGEGSAILRAHIDVPAAPKVHERVHAVASRTAPKAAMKAFSEIDELLAKDNAVGHVAVAGQNVILFPGRLRAARETIGPVRRSTSVEGQIYSIGERTTRSTSTCKTGTKTSGARCQSLWRGSLAHICGGGERGCLAAECTSGLTGSGSGGTSRPRSLFCWTNRRWKIRSTRSGKC